MTYRVKFTGPSAARQFHELPPEAQDALVRRVVALTEAPWDDVRLVPPGEDPSFRTTQFGENGLLVFFVDEDEAHIGLHLMVWVG